MRSPRPGKLPKWPGKHCYATAESRSAIEALGACHQHHQLSLKPQTERCRTVLIVGDAIFGFGPLTVDNAELAWKRAAK